MHFCIQRLALIRIGTDHLLSTYTKRTAQSIVVDYATRTSNKHSARTLVKTEPSVCCDARAKGLQPFLILDQ